MKEQKRKSPQYLLKKHKRNSKFHSEEKNHSSLLLPIIYNRRDEHSKSKQKSLKRIGCKKNISAFKATIQQNPQIDKQNTKKVNKFPIIVNNKKIVEEGWKPVRRIGKNRSVPAYIQTLSQQNSVITSKKVIKNLNNTEKGSQLIKPQQKSNLKINKNTQNRFKEEIITNILSPQNSEKGIIHSVISEEQTDNNDSFCKNIYNTNQQDKLSIVQGHSDAQSVNKTDKSLIIKGSFQKLVNQPIEEQISSDSRIQELAYQIQMNYEKNMSDFRKQKQTSQKYKQQNSISIPQSSFNNFSIKQDSQQQPKMKQQVIFAKQNKIASQDLEKLDQQINYIEQSSNRTQVTKFQKQSVSLHTPNKKSEIKNQKNVLLPKKVNIYKYETNYRNIQKMQRSQSDLTKSALLNKQFSSPSIKKDKLTVSHGATKVIRQQQYRNQQVLNLSLPEKIKNIQHPFILYEYKSKQTQGNELMKQKTLKLLKKQSLATRFQPSSQKNKNTSQPNSLQKMKNKNKKHDKNIGTNNLKTEVYKTQNKT